MNATHIRFYYPHVETRNRHGDVVKKYRVATAYTHINENQIEVSFSFCSPRDRFLRKEGRNLAKDRLSSHDSVILHAQRRNTTETIDEFLRLSRILSHIPSGFPVKQLRKAFYVDVIERY